jgi:hypothetical protein
LLRSGQHGVAGKPDRHYALEVTGVFPYVRILSTSARAVSMPFEAAAFAEGLAPEPFDLQVASAAGGQTTSAVSSGPSGDFLHNCGSGSCTTGTNPCSNSSCSSCGTACSSCTSCACTGCSACSSCSSCSGCTSCGGCGGCTSCGGCGGCGHCGTCTNPWGVTSCACIVCSIA